MSEWSHSIPIIFLLSSSVAPTVPAPPSTLVVTRGVPAHLGQQLQRPRAFWISCAWLPTSATETAVNSGEFAGVFVHPRRHWSIVRHANTTTPIINMCSVPINPVNWILKWLAVGLVEIDKTIVEYLLRCWWGCWGYTTGHHYPRDSPLFWPTTPVSVCQDTGQSTLWW